MTNEQRIKIIFYKEQCEEGRFVEAEVYVDGSIAFLVHDDETLNNTARNIIKKFGERTKVWISWGQNPDYIREDYSRIYDQREARFWDSGNGAGREPTLMSPTDILC